MNPSESIDIRLCKSNKNCKSKNNFQSSRSDFASRSRRRLPSSTSSSSVILVLLALSQLVLLAVSANPLSGGPNSRLDSTKHKARFNKEQLISRYNFHCIGPNDVKPHEGFTSEPPPTTNASLTELKHDLEYIRSMTEQLKMINEMGTTMDNTIEQTLPMLPNPIQLSEFDNMDYTKAFNRSNHLLMQYLNDLARAEMIMAESAKLDGRLFNITDIEYELAAWLHKLHLKMIQNSVDIDCEGIRALLRTPHTPMRKASRKDYLPLLMRKLMHIMGNVIQMFDKAIKHEGAEEERKSAAKKSAWESMAAKPEAGKRGASRYTTAAVVAARARNGAESSDESLSRSFINFNKKVNKKKYMQRLMQRKLWEDEEEDE